MSKEVWKPIVGYEGFYEVSNCGKVRRVCCDKRGNTYSGRILKGCRVGGYVRVKLCRNGVMSNVRTNVLVRQMFGGADMKEKWKG